MAKFTLVIEVDEDSLRKVRAESIGAKAAKKEKIEDAIEQEFGWVNQSGISVQSIKPINKEDEIFDHFDKYLSMEREHYPKVLTALKKALKKKPSDMVDNVEFDAGTGDEVIMESVDTLESLEYSFTVERFCEMCGIE